MPDSVSNSFIVYACPTGELAEQLDRYFQHSLAICGANAAHRYMPHCTLTGFFQDEETAIPFYVQVLDRALRQAQPCPSPVITIQQLTFRPDWHGLELQSDWLKNMIASFATLATSPTRQDALRLKDWLHLSLAYEFQPEQSKSLIQLAQEYINLQASVQWELRFYQRHPDQGWICHQSWQLDSLMLYSLPSITHHATSTQPDSRNPDH
jgi:ubiquitin-associated SH3 domain-containing protein